MKNLHTRAIVDQNGLRQCTHVCLFEWNIGSQSRSRYRQPIELKFSCMLKMDDNALSPSTIFDMHAVFVLLKILYGA